MLALHLLQSSLVFINTQPCKRSCEIPGGPTSSPKKTGGACLRCSGHTSTLIYGRFRLDMNTRPEPDPVGRLSGYDRRSDNDHYHVPGRVRRPFKGADKNGVIRTAGVSILLNSARRTCCMREYRGADGHMAAGTSGAATGVAGGVAAGAGRTGERSWALA